MALGKPNNDVEVTQESSTRARIFSVLKSVVTRVTTPPDVNAYDWKSFHDASYQGHPLERPSLSQLPQAGEEVHYQNMA